MPSTFAWLDTSERERRRIIDVVDLFSLRDTRDQLGIAGIRDAWSDRLAPGTSTTQTRARYFLFVPWIYLELEGKGVGADKVARRARAAELALTRAIQQTDPEAVPIGARVGDKLKRLPSDIYWGGLGVLRIRLFEGSRDAYHKSFGRASEIEVGLEDAPLSGNWNPHLPQPPKSFPDHVTLQLERAEAEYLRDQILQHAQGSLLAHLVGLEEAWDEVEFPWDHTGLRLAPERLRTDLEHARLFSLAMHGAALLYNLMVAEEFVLLGYQKRKEDWVGHYRDEIESWAGSVTESAAALRAWDRAGFWSITHRHNPRIPTSSKAFADDWIDRVLAARDPLALSEDREARKRIEQREFHLKRHRARLQHREHLAKWTGSSGARALDYRWPITQRIVRDVHEGLRRA